MRRSPRRCCRRCCRAASADLQRGDRRQRHLDQRHADAVRHRRGGQARRAARSPTPSDPRLRPSARRSTSVLKILALQVVRDGEGARKQVEVTVTGAESARSAKRIALSIANSPLVKTAVAGEDANWGRVVMAVGKAGEPADRDRLSIWFGDNRLAVEGERDPAYSEAATSAYMKGDEIAHPRRSRPRHAARRRSGPATSPRNMSPSTATTGADGSAGLADRPPTRRTRRSCAASRRPAFAPGRRRPCIMTAPG